MNFREWQMSSGAYYADRKDRLVYAIQHDEGFDEFARLPAMQWIRTIELMGELSKSI